MRATGDHVATITRYVKAVKHAEMTARVSTDAQEAAHLALLARQTAWQEVRAAEVPLGAYALPGDIVVVVGSGDYPPVVEMRCGKGSQW